jgi:hypothetical protein
MRDSNKILHSRGFTSRWSREVICVQETAFQNFPTYTPSPLGDLLRAQSFRVYLPCRPERIFTLNLQIDCLRQKGDTISDIVVPLVPRPACITSCPTIYMRGAARSIIDEHESLLGNWVWRAHCRTISVRVQHKRLDHNLQLPMACSNSCSRVCAKGLMSSILLCVPSRPSLTMSG